MRKMINEKNKINNAQGDRAVGRRQQHSKKKKNDESCSLPLDERDEHTRVRVCVLDVCVCVWECIYVCIYDEFTTFF